MREVPGSILFDDVQFSFSYLVEKKFEDCEKTEVSLKWHRLFTKHKRASPKAEYIQLPSPTPLLAETPRLRTKPRFPAKAPTKYNDTLDFTNLLFLRIV